MIPKIQTILEKKLVGLTPIMRRF